MKVLHSPQRYSHTAPTYAYTLCGWHTLSDIPLTCVPSSAYFDQSPDVVVQMATGNAPVVHNVLDRAALDHSGEGWLIKIPGLADFEIIDGKLIKIWPTAEAQQKDIEIFVFGLAWATLCHQRRLLPLHASAIATTRGIVAFAGPSGSGKSTTAALMTSLGYKLVADDMLPVSFNRDTTLGAWPYLRRLKLESRPIDQLALTPIEPVSEKLDIDKYFVCPNSVAADRWARLDRIYLLEPAAAPRTPIVQITGAEAVRALVDHTYYLDFVLDSGRLRDHLTLCSRLASMIPVYHLPLSRPFAIETKSLICAHLEEGAKRQTIGLCSS